jgi:predicted DNA-binding protein YlxM (UPF0122 family)
LSEPLNQLEKTERVNLLLDFFGDLLTERQRDFCGSYYVDNLSLSEIAGRENITRQAVRDLLARTVKILENYEEKTQVVSRHLTGISALATLEDAVFQLNTLNQKHFRNKLILELSNRMYEALQILKGADEEVGV